MAKNRQQFLCSKCGSMHPKWMGKCPDCGTWDSLEAYTPPTPTPASLTKTAADRPPAISSLVQSH